MSKLEELRNELALAMQAAKESMKQQTSPAVINIFHSDVQIYTAPPQRSRDEHRK